MAAKFRHFFAHSNISKQFSKYFFDKYIEAHCKHARERFFFVLASRQAAFSSENSSFSATNSLMKSRRLHMGSLKSAETSDYVDPEFVTEEFPLTSENLKDIGDMIKNIKEKTGVIMKEVDDKDEENKLKIIIGGTRHDVQQAIFYIKSSLDQDPSEKRSNLLQDDKAEQKYSLKKEKPIWAYYRRNFKGQKPPIKTRKKCIRGKGESQIVSGNPCPICRLYLGGGYKLDYKDVDLLSQFISPHSGEIFEASKTGLCRHQQDNLVKAVQTAKDYGLLPYSIPGPRSIAQPAKHAEIPINVRLK